MTDTPELSQGTEERAAEPDVAETGGAQDEQSPGADEGAQMEEDPELQFDEDIFTGGRQRT